MARHAQAQEVLQVHILVVAVRIQRVQRTAKQESSASCSANDPREERAVEVRSNISAAHDPDHTRHFFCCVGSPGSSRQLPLQLLQYRGCLSHQPSE